MASTTNSHYRHTTLAAGFVVFTPLEWIDDAGELKLKQISGNGVRLFVKVMRRNEFVPIGDYSFVARLDKLKFMATAFRIEHMLREKYPIALYNMRHSIKGPKHYTQAASKFRKIISDDMQQIFRG